MTARGAALRVLARVVDAAAGRLERTTWPTREAGHRARKAASIARDVGDELRAHADDLDGADDHQAVG